MNTANPPLITPSGLVYSNSNIQSIYSTNTTNNNYTTWKILAGLKYTTNVVLFGAQDMQLEKRVLLTAQTNAIENGLYNVSESVWNRTSDLQNGTHASGMMIHIIEEGRFFYCNNDYNVDVTGTNILQFVEIELLPHNAGEAGLYVNQPGGVGGCIQYVGSNPINYFNGSTNFLFLHNETFANRIVLGQEGKESNITSTYNLNIESGNSSNLNIQTGNGDNKGNLTIMTGTSASNDSGNVNITTGNVFGLGSIINLVGTNINVSNGTGTIKPLRNIKFTATSNIYRNHVIKFNNLLTFEKGGMTLTKSAVTSAGISPVTINSTQGTITITNPSTIGISASSNLTVNNNTALSSSLILVNILKYLGTGTPIIEVRTRSNGSFVLTIANVSTAASLSSSALIIGFLIV
jgi:hypothetical protein